MVIRQTNSVPLKSSLAMVICTYIVHITMKDFSLRNLYLPGNSAKLRHDMYAIAYI